MKHSKQSKGTSAPHKGERIQAVQGAAASIDSSSKIKGNNITGETRWIAADTIPVAAAVVVGWLLNHPFESTDTAVPKPAERMVRIDNGPVDIDAAMDGFIEKAVADIERGAVVDSWDLVSVKPGMDFTGNKNRHESKCATELRRWRFNMRALLQDRTVQLAILYMAASITAVGLKYEGQMSLWREDLDRLANKAMRDAEKYVAEHPNLTRAIKA